MNNEHFAVVIVCVLNLHTYSFFITKIPLHDIFPHKKTHHVCTIVMIGITTKNIPSQIFSVMEHFAIDMQL